MIARIGSGTCSRSARSMKIALIFAALFGLTGQSSACSLAPFSEEFKVNSHRASKADRLRSVTIAGINFVPALSDSGSCGGVGWIEITLAAAGDEASRLQRYGYVIHPIAGVNDGELFPTYPLAFVRYGASRTTLFWGWTGITPNPNGQVKWQLEVIPVSRSGVRGTPIPLCVSSNNSCPDQSKSVEAVNQR